MAYTCIIKKERLDAEITLFVSNK